MTGRIIIISILISLIFISNSYSQKKKLKPYKVVKAGKPLKSKSSFQYNFDFIDVEKGLNSSIILSIVEDKNGLLWIGTDGGGINIYDGNSFEYITEQDGLLSNLVNVIYEDSRGNVWIGTQEGIIYHDGKRLVALPQIGNTAYEILDIFEDVDSNIWIGTYGDGLLRYNDNNLLHYTTNHGLSNNNVTSLYQDKNGRLLIGTYGGGLNILENNSFDIYPLSGDLYSYYINAIGEDNSGNLWIGTDGGGIIKVYNGIVESYTVNDGISSDNIRSILIDKKGKLWFGTDDGITTYNNNTFSKISNKEGLNNFRIYTLEEDRNGNIWIGSEGNGIAKYYGETFIHYTIENGLINHKINAILEDENGHLWFGTDGSGVSRYDGEYFYHYSKDQGLSNNTIVSAVKDKQNNLWFGTYGGGVTMLSNHYFIQYTMHSGLNSNDIMSIIEDDEGNIWLGTYRGASKIDKDKYITNYTIEDGLSSEYINHLIEDHKNNIWFATYGGGISKFDGAKFINYTKDEGLNSNDVYSLNIDSENKIWIGSFGGISIVEDDNLFSISKGEELSNNSIVSILFDSNNQIWLGTLMGINRLTKVEEEESITTIFNKYSIKNYGIADGFKGNDCNSNAVYEDKNGNIWWGTGKKLTMYNPDKDIPDDQEPITHITNLSLFFEDIDWLNFDSALVTNDQKEQQSDINYSNIKFDSITSWWNLPKNLVLPYNQNHLTFNFIGISLKQPEKVRYKFMLEGLESTWNPVTNRTEATYSNLPPGTYSFKVISTNPEDVWNNSPTSYDFIITPPWWETLWFRISGVIFILLSIYGIFRWRLRALKQRQKELERIVKERTAEVVKQKNEIELQRDHIAYQNEQITDSITYASRIQSAVMPSKNFIEQILPNYFILFKPRDIVSGDFYWMTTKDDKIVVVAADCTGHGVPGAFMSMLGVSFLNEIVNKSEVTQADLILNQLRDNVISTLGQEASTKGSQTKDGMDIALCVFDFANNTLQFAGAYNPLFMFRNGELIVTKANKMPIGIHVIGGKQFTNHVIEFKKGDLFYIFSDGYIDQFGGESGHKFMSKPFKRLLSEIHDKPMDVQKEILESTHNEWRRVNSPDSNDIHEQIDDILVIGIRV